MKQPHQFPAISHFCDLISEEYGRVDTQEVLNSISIHSATKMEYLLMLLHRNQPENMNGLANGDGWDEAEMQELHPDMKLVAQFFDAIMGEDYHGFA